MPCSSEHMEPNAREIESKGLCRAIMYLVDLGVLDTMFVNSRVSIGTVYLASSNAYGLPDRCDDLCQMMCEVCSSGDIDKYMYDGRIEKMRWLADWWQGHEQFDQKKNLIKEFDDCTSSLESVLSKFDSSIINDKAKAAINSAIVEVNVKKQSVS